MHQHLPSPPASVHFWSLWLFFITLVPEKVSPSLLFSSNTKCYGQHLSPKVFATFWIGHLASGCKTLKFLPERSCTLRRFTFLRDIQHGFYWAQAGLISLSCPCESGESSRGEAWWTSLLWFLCCCMFLWFWFVFLFPLFLFFFFLIACLFWDRSHLALMFCQACDSLKNFITISGIVSISNYFCFLPENVWLFLASSPHSPCLINIAQKICFIHVCFFCV